MADVVGGYQILRKIATGGMGVVYAAVRRGPGGFTKRVAIKLLHPHLELGGEARRRFAGEARLAAQLTHPNIVDVYGFETDGASRFIVMEYVHGCNLNTLLRAASPLPPPIALHIASEVLYGLEALHALHEQDDRSGVSGPVIHRDLSPKNILLSTAGEVKLADFGLAQIVGQNATLASGLRGTVAYMSPEHANGEPLDPRSDLFTVGLVLWEMLTGRSAYQRSSEMETLRLAQTGAAANLVLDGIPAELHPTLRRALACDRDERFPDASSLRQTLGDHLDSLGRPARDDLVRLVHPHVIELDEPEPDQPRVTQVVSSGEAPTVPRGLRPTAAGAGRRGILIVWSVWSVWIAGSVLLLVGAGLLGWLVLQDRDPPGATGTDAGDVVPAPVPRPADAKPAPPDAPSADRASPDQSHPPRPTRSARHRHGMLHLNTLPVWSRVWIDGKLQGTTPVKVRLRAGRHRVRLRPLGTGKPVSHWVTVQPRRTTMKIFTFDEAR